MATACRWPRDGGSSKWLEDYLLLIPSCRAADTAVHTAVANCDPALFEAACLWERCCRREGVYEAASPPQGFGVDAELGDAQREDSMPGDLGRDLGDADDAADQDAATYAAAGDADNVGGHGYAHDNGHDSDADQTYDSQSEQNLYYPSFLTTLTRVNTCRRTRRRTCLSAWTILSTKRTTSRTSRRTCWSASAWTILCTTRRWGRR